MELLEIDAAGSHVEPCYSTPDFSVWTIKLARRIPADSVTYFRFRIKATSIGRCWNWRRSWLERKRIIIDFRLSDVRELWYLSSDSLKHYIHDIECVNFFLIAPARFRLVAASPLVHYSRILEGYAWKSYLKRSPSYFRKEKLIIHQWRTEKDRVVNLKSPLRIFADLEDPRTLNFGPNMLMGLAMVSIVALVVAAKEQAIVASVNAWSKLASVALSRHIPAASVTGFLIICSGLISKIETGKKVIRFLQSGFSRVERYVFSDTN
jgi:hypothetical protein